MCVCTAAAMDKVSNLNPPSCRGEEGVSELSVCKPVMYDRTILCYNYNILTTSFWKPKEGVGGYFSGENLRRRQNLYSYLPNTSCIAKAVCIIWLNLHRLLDCTVHHGRGKTNTHKTRYRWTDRPSLGRAHLSTHYLSIYPPECIHLWSIRTPF